MKKIKYDRKIDICPWCGADVMVKHGKYGFFQSCMRWPACKFSANMYDKNAVENTK